MVRRCLLSALLATLMGLGAATVARAEGTAQLGPNQDLVEATVIKVDVVTAGEVINISVGNDSTSDTSPVTVTVTDPSGTAVSGSPFTVGPGSPGWLPQPDQLPPATIPNPLQVTTTAAGTYTVQFDNTRTDLGQNYEQVVDPFDITVTPDASTAVQPASPPGGYGRVHSTTWKINAHKFTKDASSNASFYVLTPTGAGTDHTWLLQFNGLAGFYFDVAGNELGMPAPNSGFSIDEYKTPVAGSCPAGYMLSGDGSLCIAFGPKPQFEIYLQVPEAAQGGGAAPQITNYAFSGPSPLCTCAVQTLQSEFRFTSDRNGTYQLVIDIDGNGSYDPAGGDVLLSGEAKVGANSVPWDGTDNAGNAVTPGSYNTRLSVRTGEFHFVGRDIETARPGLRIFSVHPPLPSTTPAGAKMYWNDTRINDAFYTIDPVSTLPDGLSSGTFGSPAVCSEPTTRATANAHCWGNFTADPTLSPGDERYIDTWVFFEESVEFTVACVVDGSADSDGDGLSRLEECGTLGTDPTKGDTDGDGLPDSVETGSDSKTDPTKSDTDGDGLPDGVEDSNKNGKVDAGETDPAVADSDGDGIADGKEDANQNGTVDAGESDPTKGDTDGDGISDGVEDSNQDGLRDPGEMDPTKEDTDGDGLKDGVEDTNKNGKLDAGETDPTVADTDGDGLLDGVEDANQNGLLDAGETDPAKADSDFDGLGDGVEDANQNGKVDAGETDPTKTDTDGDGLGDGMEQGVDPGGNKILGANPTDPLKADTDGDGLTDAEEDINKNGVLDTGETDGSKTDTDGDGLPDGIERGVNADGSAIADANQTDPLVADTDGDGLSDGVEDANHNGVVDRNMADPSLSETDPQVKDTDGDGLPDGWIDEDNDGTFDAGEGEDKNLNGKLDAGETDPRLADTDGGGEPDGSEVLKTGHDPRDPTDDRRPDVQLVGGGGCAISAAAGGASPTALLLLLLGGVWLLRRRRLRRRGRPSGLSRGAALLLLLGLSRPAAAQDSGPIQFPVVNFQPALSTMNYVVTEGGFTLPHLYPSVGLMVNYAHRPLELVAGSDDERLADVIKYQVNMDLMLAIGFWNRLELGVGLPVTVAQDSDDLALLDRDPGSALSGGLGDIRIQPKLRMMTRGPATLALALPFTVPTGKQESFLGDKGLTFTPKLIVALDTDVFGMAFNVGYRLREDQSHDVSETQRVVVDDEVVGSLGLRVALWQDHLDLLADGFVSTSIEEQDREEIPVEVLGALRAFFPYGIIATAGAGAGVTRGIGAPKFRIFGALAWQYTKSKQVVRQADPDPDKDGILNPDDKCPNDPEDKDGFEDGDGCPDLDNDKDGILDKDDKCPLVPEDKDGFEDGDGCPDLDNDKDGILDKDDKCPDEAEDKDQFEDADGCPEADNDKDGILDKDDKCPTEPEDKDGFEDTDGCPDLDNDKDGIPDTLDKCPMVAEDKDNFEDGDGCPDLDNDKDGILDKDDQCPNEPEIFNKVKDDDGCPDKARGPVKITREKITAPPVYFASGKDRILPRSFPILTMVAQTLKDNAWVKKVRIEGHTDSRGNDAFNLNLSERRANSVKVFLIQKGVDPARLSSVGFGETRPIASNRTRRGRARNRRVEFIIVDPAQAQSTPAPQTPPAP